MSQALLRRLALLCLLSAGNLFVSGDANANIVCLISGSPSLNFGSVVASDAAGAAGSGSIAYACTNYDTSAASLTLCAANGNSPSYPGSVSQPEMQNGGGVLKFNAYTDSTHTAPWTSTNVLTASVQLAAGIGKTASGYFTLTGYISGNQSIAAGAYTANFYNNILGVYTGGACQSSATVSGHSFSGQGGFTVTVSANVASACTVSAGATLSFGTVAAGPANASGSNAIYVNCPAGTAYYVGLAPSNGSTTGAGTMAAASGDDGDKLSYQLHSGSTTGPVWGNTATATSVGNGAAGTGSGASQTLTVYATATSADVQPGTYTDTVTIYVNY